MVGPVQMQLICLGELTCTYKNNKKIGLPAIDLGSSMTALTAWGNDFNFESF